MICVYAPDCTDFSNNGIGPVFPESAVVTETLNGEYELTLVHPIDENGKWQRLAEGYILRAPVPAGMTPQVDFVEQPVTGTEIYKVSTNRDERHLQHLGSVNRKAAACQLLAGPPLFVLELINCYFVNSMEAMSHSPSIAVTRTVHASAGERVMEEYSSASSPGTTLTLAC